MRFKVLQIDVWGNEIDGYERNNWFYLGEITISDDLDCENEIIQALKTIGIKIDKRIYYIDDDFMNNIDIVRKKDNKPILELQSIDF